MNLFNYMGWNVQIVDTDGNVYTGCVIVVNGADDYDSENAEDTITIETKEDRIINFSKSKIVQIEYIDWS